MSRSEWNTINPASGKGNADVSIGGYVHTGRLERNSTPVFKPVDSSLAARVPEQVLNVIQEGKAEFVEINNVAAGKDAGSVAISGKSNSSKLTFSLGEGDIAVTLPPNYSANGATARNGSPISGDPGAVAEYEFILTVSVPKNTTVNVRTKVINVVTAGGQSASSTITQEAGDPFLTVSTNNVTLPASGTPVVVVINSNIEWKAE